MLGKLIGGALILGCTTYTGYQIGGKYARRPLELRDLQTALAVLQTEIDYGATPLPDALLAAARAGGDTVGPLFASAAAGLAGGGGVTPGEALRAALNDWAPGTALKETDLAVLDALAGVLGTSGRADQVRHLALARERLTGEEARAAEERAKYEKLSRYMGVLSGAALVLILL